MKQEKLKDFLKPLSVVWEYKTKPTKAKIFVENNGNGGENPEEFEIQEGLCVLWQQHWQKKLL